MDDRRKRWWPLVVAGAGVAAVGAIAAWQLTSAALEASSDMTGSVGADAGTLPSAYVARPDTPEIGTYKGANSRPSAIRVVHVGVGSAAAAGAETVLETAVTSTKVANVPPDRKALVESFKSTAMGNVMECMVEMVGAGDSFRGSLNFQVSARSVEEGTVDYFVESLEVRRMTEGDPEDLPDPVVGCLDQSINSLVAQIPPEALDSLRDGGEVTFETALSLDLKGAEQHDADVH